MISLITYWWWLAWGIVDVDAKEFFAVVSTLELVIELSLIVIYVGVNLAFWWENRK